MRLRSGAIIEVRSRNEAIEEPNEDMDRQDDSLSTAATWGTPLTARYVEDCLDTNVGGHLTLTCQVNQL
jgi:hypothetical protein